ncbi:MAG: histidine kinase [Bacteroidota bacterium]
MKTTILYIDDEIDNLTAFKAVFRRFYEIDIVTSGEEAVELLQQKEYKIIISDQRMPNMTGVAFFEKIRDKHPHTIRMILTGYADMQSIIDSINKGKIFYYISKPWNKDEIQVIIERAAEMYDLREKNRDLFRANVKARFDILKNQINPHFLFNSMNILSALIPKDAQKAVAFTNQFSKLYRSLLQLREQQLISLEEELEFVNAFLHLQKIRFDEALHLKMDIDHARGFSLPPFSLQLLVENAIKHNVVSEKNPLTIFIKREEDFLTVSNNLQPRNSMEESTGTGLLNLKHRYDLLGMEGMEIQKTENLFEVKIPLIEEL